MKLKKTIGFSLLLYAFSAGTIIIVGLWIVPSAQIGGLKVGSVPATGQKSTQNANSSSTPANSSAGGASSPTTPASTSTPGQIANSRAATSTQSNSTSTSTSGGGSTPAPSPPPPPPPPAPSCGSAGGKCTAAQVAGHSSQTDCWVIYNGGYYIVTSYVNQHPGGKAVFNSTTCGHDITSYLNGSQSVGNQRHSHSNTAYNILKSYYVGAVSG